VTAAKKAKLRERDFVRNGCRWKLAHSDLLLAIRHAARMSRLEGAPFMFYGCEECGGIHVGRLKEGESWVMYGAYSDNLRKLQGFSEAK
jgi:hypothetical protein